VTAVSRSPPVGSRRQAGSASRLAWLVYAVALGLIGLATGLWLVVHRPVAGAVGYEYWHEGMVNGLAWATVGAVIATRRPEHPVAWLFLGAGLVGAAQLVTGEYAAAFLAASGPSAGVAVAAWASYQFQSAVVGLLIGMLLVFPTGQPPSRRWWVLAWTIAAGVVLAWVGQGLAPARYQDFPGVENPFGIAGLATTLKWIAGAGAVLSTVGFLGALASLFVRFARARGLERQQLKWFVYVAGLGFAVLFLPNLIPGASGVAGTLAWTLVPASLSAAAAAVAILRYRLYDIDRLINRTVVYGLLTALLAGLYAGLVLLLGQLFGDLGAQPPSWAVAGATLAVAALFQPARRRIQAAVDRRFNRRRYDAAKTIQAYSVRLRDEVDLDTLSAELLAVVDQTMQPTGVSLWLRPSAPGSSGPPRSEAQPTIWAY
jgi:MFS family permease